MKNTQKILTKLIATTFVLHMFFTQMVVQAATNSNLMVSVSDTIAGYSALVNVNNTLENTDIEIQLIKPSGTEIILTETTDENGELQMDIAGYHTAQSGIYHVAARFAEMNEEFGTETDFRVYPSEVSANRSQITLNRTTAQALTGDSVTLTVQLKDEYGNPIKGHTVSVISSRTADRVERISSISYTNDIGALQFGLSSTTSGVSTYAVMDTTSNVTLESRAKVAYLAPVTTSIGRGGEASILFSSANAQSTEETTTAEEGIISGFTIKDLESTVGVNESLGITVNAVDGFENLITNYTGTIRFSSSDTNAALPDDYTFTENDLGTHTFNLAVSFATTGTQTLSIMDSDNEDLKGETSVEVTNDTNNTTSDTSGATFTLLSPLEGTVSENTITVSGITSSSLSVEIYDNDSKMATTVAGSDGSFSYTTDPLVDGTHSISVIVVDGSGNTVAASNNVNVTIDTTGPVIDAVSIEPEGDLNPSAPITLTLYSEPNLSQISVVMNQTVTDLTEKIDQPGVYTATLMTPETVGTYDFDVIISDQLSNQISYVKQATITITEENAVVAPEQVTGVTAVAGDGSVTLSWEATTSDTPITQYKIAYGPSETGLYTTAETTDGSTSWEIRNLNNNFKYYFAIVGMDEDGDESSEQSVVIASMPKAAATTITVTPEEETTATEVLHESAPEETPDSGPEVWVLAVLTMITVLGYSLTTKKV